MKKQTMPSREALRALYPSHEEKDAAAVRATLARLSDDEKEKPIMKKKVSAALVCACILLAITCAAIAVSTGVFGLFAGEFGEDSGIGRFLNALDQQSAPGGDTQTVAPSEDRKYGKADFTVEQSYYDGETLSISYSLKTNGDVIDDSWLPADGEMETLGMTETAIAGVSTPEQIEKARQAWMLDDAALIERLKAIRETGEKKGLIRLNTYLGDGAYWGEGEDDYIDLSMSDEKRQEDGAILGYKRFESPLPDAVRGKDRITIRFSLYRGTHYIYFDGESWYTGGGERTREPIYVTIARAAANAAREYPFKAEFSDYFVEGTVTVSPIEVKLAAVLTGKNGKPLYDEEDREATVFNYYAVYAGDEELDAFLGEYGAHDLSMEVLNSYNAPAAPVDSLRLVPVFTDRAKEAADEDGRQERPEEAVVVSLTAAPAVP